MTKLYAERKLDKLGRIVLPIEMRKILDIEPEDCVLVSLDENRIVLEKQRPGCCFCGETENLIRYRNYFICRKCVRELQEELD